MIKKILFSATVYTHLANFHKPYIQLLQDKGYEVHAAANPDHGRKEEIESLGVVCWDIPFSRSLLKKDNFIALKKLNRLFNLQYFDLIHVHSPISSFLVRYAAKRKTQGKVLYTAHGFHFFEGAPQKNWYLFYPAEKIAKRWTDGLIVMNDEDFNLGKRLGFKENKDLYFVHGVGVDITHFNSNFSPMRTATIKKELNIDSDALLVTCVAELTTRKNQFFLLNNWKEIISKNPSTHLLLVGDGVDYEKIANFVKEEDLKNIYLLGFRKDVVDIINASDVIALTSKHEGLPKCLMEAMACGKPIITTNVRGSRELVEHNENGIVVELTDDSALIESFTILLQDQKTRTEFGKRGINKISKYSLESVLKEMEPIYNFYLK